MPMNRDDTDIIVGALSSVADSLEVLTRVAAYFAVKAGMPPEELQPPAEGGHDGNHP